MVKTWIKRQISRNLRDLKIRRMELLEIRTQILGPCDHIVVVGGADLLAAAEDRALH